MAEQNLFCLCGRCSRKLRSAAARRVGMGSTCCRKETGKTITQLLKELDEQEPQQRQSSRSRIHRYKKEPRSKARTLLSDKPIVSRSTSKSQQERES